MPFTDTLPAQVYLLAYDLGKDKLTARPWLDYLVQGAALAELFLDGYLAAGEEGVRPRSGRWPAEPILGAVLRTIEGSDQLSWRRALRHSRPTLLATRDQLVRDGVLALRGRKTAALTKAQVQRLQDQTRGILLSNGDAAVSGRQAALVVLAAVVPLTTIVPGPQWRPRQDRVARLTRLAAREAPAFTQLVTQMRRTRGR